MSRRTVTDLYHGGQAVLAHHTDSLSIKIAVELAYLNTLLIFTVRMFVQAC